MERKPNRGNSARPNRRRDDPRRQSDQDKRKGGFRERSSEEDRGDTRKKKPYGSRSEAPRRNRPGNRQEPAYNRNRPVGNKPNVPEPVATEIRLNRYIANAGICSRRDADELILTGQIKVNGKVVREMGLKVGPKDRVAYKGRTLRPEKTQYVLLNKPKDFITTMEDTHNRKTVMSLVDNACEERIYPVGRLDRHTTGLLLFTNDGELARRLTHPSQRIRKIYQVELDKPITENDFDKIVQGVTLEDGLAPVDELAIVGEDARVLGIEIHVGRNRIVRRIFEHLGYRIQRLDRVMFGDLTKKDLPRGNWRHLSAKEIMALKGTRDARKPKK